MPDPDATPAPNDAPTLKADDNAARQIANAGDDGLAAGGGLGGAAAARPIAGSARAPGGATPNSPIDLGVSPDGKAKEDQEAQRRSLADDADEPAPASR